MLNLVSWSLPELAAALGIVMIGALVHGAVGMGLGLVAAPVLLSVRTPSSATRRCWGARYVKSNCLYCSSRAFKILAFALWGLGYVNVDAGGVVGFVLKALDDAQPGLGEERVIGARARLYHGPGFGTDQVHRQANQLLADFPIAVLGCDVKPG